MAQTRTIGHDKLTESDRDVIRRCERIVTLLTSAIPTADARAEFARDYGKTAYSRDAATGRGAGKLQRDALTTRGRQDKSPLSNRNFRWHPLVLAYTTAAFASEVQRIAITRSGKLAFTIGGKSESPETVYALDNTCCAPYGKWSELADALKGWGADEWSENRCTIPAAEYAPRDESLCTFASLGLAVACQLFHARDSVYRDVLDTLLETGVPQSIVDDIPPLERLVLCPLCLRPIDATPAAQPSRPRPETWQPAWRASKRDEGDEGSLQMTHAFPLIEQEIRHRPSMVFYGHRWCNVAMTDHSVEDTVDFMRAIVQAHNDEQTR